MLDIDFCFVVGLTILSIYHHLQRDACFKRKWIGQFLHLYAISASFVPIEFLTTAGYFCNICPILDPFKTTKSLYKSYYVNFPVSMHVLVVSYILPGTLQNLSGFLLTLNYSGKLE